MSAETISVTFELPCDSAEAIRFITLAQRTFDRDAPNSPEKYNEFVKLLTRYREGEINLSSLLRQVRVYLCDHPQLIPKFNAFLPSGYSVISPPTSPASNATIADRRHASRKLLTEKELAEQQSLRYLEKVKAAYRKPDGSDGLEVRMFLDLLRKKIDKQEDVIKLRNDIHTLFYLHPSLANEFDGFLHREYFERQRGTTGVPTTPAEPGVPDLASPTVSPTFEGPALLDNDLTPTQKTLELQSDTSDMDIDVQPNPTSPQTSQARTPSPVPSLSASSRTVSVESSPSNCSVSLTSNAPSSPRMEDVNHSDGSNGRGSPILAPLPFYPAPSGTSTENGGVWEGGPAPTTEAQAAQKTLYRKGLMDFHLDRPRSVAAAPPPVTRANAVYPLTCNPADTTFANGVVSMPQEFEIREDGWIHGASNSKSVLYPFGVAAGKEIRLEVAPTVVEPAMASPVILPSVTPMPRLLPSSLPPKPSPAPTPLRRSYAKVVQRGPSQPQSSPLMATRMSPLPPTFPAAANRSSGMPNGTFRLSTLSSTWVNAAAAGPSRGISSSSGFRSSKGKQKRSKRSRGVGSDPDPEIPADAIRKIYGHGAVGEGRPRTDIKWVDEGSSV